MAHKIPPAENHGCHLSGLLSHGGERDSSRPFNRHKSDGAKGRFNGLTLLQTARYTSLSTGKSADALTSVEKKT